MCYLGYCIPEHLIVKACCFSAQDNILWYFYILLFFITLFALQSCVLAVLFANLVFTKPLIEFALEKKLWRIIFLICEVERNLKLIISVLCKLAFFPLWKEKFPLFFRMEDFLKLSRLEKLFVFCFCWAKCTKEVVSVFFSSDYEASCNLASGKYLDWNGELP